MQTINPYTRQVVFDYEYFDEPTTEKCLEKAENSFQNWKLISVDTRIEYVKKLIEVLKADKEKLALSCVSEMGKPITQARAEIDKCIWLCEYYISNSKQILQQKIIETDALQSYVLHEPLGIILGIMPWNFPYWQVFRFAIPTIMAGNCVVVKHASNVMQSAIFIEELFTKAGFPENIYTNLQISGVQAQKCIENPIIKAVSLTGSEQAGREVAKTAGTNLKKCVLELGGNNAFIVCKDADLDKTIAVAINARLQNAGQSCIAAKRFLIHKSIENEFINKLISSIKLLIFDNPVLEKTQMGALARIDLADELHLQIEKSIEKGAEVVYQGRRESAHFEPVVLKNVTETMEIFKEETFGPVFSISTFDTFKEAIQQSNNSNFGLGVSIFTSDYESVIKYINQFNEGAVFINELVKSDPRLPFGGIKNSGYGRELSADGLLEFVNKKTVYIKS